MNSNSSVLPIVNFFLIILIILFLILIFFESRRGVDFFFGTTYRIQQGVMTGNSDTFNTTMADLYIGRSSSALTLTIQPSASNIIGRTIAIKNDSMQNITLQGASGVQIDQGELGSLVVTRGGFAQLTIENQPNSFIRLT